MLGGVLFPRLESVEYLGFPSPLLTRSPDWRMVGAVGLTQSATIGHQHSMCIWPIDQSFDTRDGKSDRMMPKVSFSLVECR